MTKCDEILDRSANFEVPKRGGISNARSDEFTDLVKSHWDQVFRICLRITRNQHDAEDAAQDCFLRAYSGLHQFEGRAQLSTWLCSIARNCSLMLLRKRKVRQQKQCDLSPDMSGEMPLFDPPDNRPDQVSWVLYAESFEILTRSLAALPITLRKTADYAIVNELPLREVSKILGISNASAKSRLFRVRCRLSRFSARWGLSSGKVRPRLESARQ